MSATYFGGEVKYTKRYKLGQLLSQLTRHFLLMTATPQESGKDKRDSVRILLDKTAHDPAFRKTLETEAQELSAIGNSYMIRHTEIGKTPLSSSEQVEYFFHRMFSLMRLILRATGRV